MMKKTGNHALPAAPITHLTLHQGRGKVTLSSFAYKYQRRNQQTGGQNFGEGEKQTTDSGGNFWCEKEERTGEI